MQQLVSRETVHHRVPQGHQHKGMTVRNEKKEEIIAIRHPCPDTEWYLQHTSQAGKASNQPRHHQRLACLAEPKNN